MVRHTNGEPVDLGPWVGFPVAQVPRPVVLLSPPVQLGEGFVDGDSKQAWLTGSVVTDVPLPAGVLELATASHSEQPAPTVLHISAVERCSGDFLCDRGPRPLRAYRLTADGLRGGCVVLDPDVDCWGRRGLIGRRQDARLVRPASNKTTSPSTSRRSAECSPSSTMQSSRNTKRASLGEPSPPSARSHRARQYPPSGSQDT